MGADAAAGAVMDAARRNVFMRMFSSALASQVVLSAASFAVGLLLIRRTSDLQYGSFVLVTGAIILATSLQRAFIAPPMVNRMTQASPAECGALVGGLHREQLRVIAGVAGVALAAALALWALRVIGSATLLLVLAGIAATAMALQREFFRMVLLAYRRAHDVLRGDTLYSALLVAGVVLATFSVAPATIAVLAAALAALVAGLLLSRTLRRSEAWDPEGAPGILRQIAPVGTWSTAGAAIHWSFSQGYAYLVAATLDIGTVAAVAATRMLAMPVNLLTTGIGSLMLPLVSRWLNDHGASVVLRRLFWFALGLGAAAIAYFLVLWLLRDWIFAVLLKKQFAQRDLLLTLWSASFVLMAINQQMLWLPVARERFRRLTSLGAVSAVLGLSCSYWGMLTFGGAGAPLGILAGEVVNCIGLSYLCLREVAPAGARALPAAVTS